jgi:hypothetical protein
MFTDDKKNEILTAFESLTDSEVDKNIKLSLLSDEEISLIEKNAFFDVSRGNKEKEEDIRRFVDGEGLIPFMPSVWGGKYASHLNKLIKKKILIKLEVVKSNVCKKVCDEFNYCEKRAAGKLDSEKAALIIAISDALVTLLTSVPLLASGASYIIKNHILDHWCNCADKAIPPNNAN